jgi:peptidoglycan hydrolase-like protein with peptidoglycan-binding domain
MESFAFLQHACAHEEDGCRPTVYAESDYPNNPNNDNLVSVSHDGAVGSIRAHSRRFVKLISLAVGATMIGSSATAIAASSQLSSQQPAEQSSAEAIAQPEPSKSSANNSAEPGAASENRAEPEESAADTTSQSEPSESAQGRSQNEPMLLSQQASDIVLQLESTGDAVTALQQRLTDLGYYNGPITGYFGSLTEAAVIEFQSDRGLIADGVVGASTTAALRDAGQGGEASAVSTGDFLRLDASGEAVTSLQTQLNELGYYDGPITGYFGPLTESAVIEFQQANGLTVDGVVGPSTESALQGSARPTASSSATPVANDGLLELGESGPRIADIQRRLRELGYYDGPVDGMYGEMTEQAVITFQRSQGLTADGIAGPNTVAALEGSNAQAGSRPSQPTPQPSATEASTDTSSDSEAGQLQQPSAANPSPSEPANPPAASETTPSVSPAPFPSPSFPSPDASSSSVAPTSPADRETVMEIQRKLQARGFYSGPVDGIMGPETQRAIEAAHRAYELTGGDIGNSI